MCLFPKFDENIRGFFSYSDHKNKQANGDENITSAKTAANVLRTK